MQTIIYCVGFERPGFARLRGRADNGCMDTGLLRSATRAEHEATESLMPPMDASLTRAQYATVLRKMYPLIAGWEAWARPHAPEDLLPLLCARRRAPLLERDLLALDEHSLPSAAFPVERVPGLSESNRAAFLGTMYVVEGSALGGQYIARHVESLLGISVEDGSAYFRGYGDETGRQWREFQRFIAAVPDDDAPQVIAAAKATFAVFGDALRS
jgi:heme oxygenase